MFLWRAVAAATAGMEDTNAFCPPSACACAAFEGCFGTSCVADTDGVGFCTTYRPVSGSSLRMGGDRSREEDKCGEVGVVLWSCLLTPPFAADLCLCNLPRMEPQTLVGSFFTRKRSAYFSSRKASGGGRVVVASSAPSLDDVTDCITRKASGENTILRWRQMGPTGGMKACAAMLQSSSISSIVPCPRAEYDIIIAAIVAKRDDGGAPLLAIIQTNRIGIWFRFLAFAISQSCFFSAAAHAPAARRYRAVEHMPPPPLSNVS